MPVTNEAVRKTTIHERFNLISWTGCIRCNDLEIKQIKLEYDLLEGTKDILR